MAEHSSGFLQQRFSVIMHKTSIYIIIYSQKFKNVIRHTVIFIVDSEQFTRELQKWLQFFINNH